MQIKLHQFAFSHFNEKARWALAYKKVPHDVETYLPGPHILAIKRLSGQTATPAFASSMIAKGNGVNPENVARSLHITQETLDRIASRIEDNPYMVGDQFSVADLSVAALLAPIANVDHLDIKRPEPIPDALETLINRYKNHPTVDWVNAVYRDFRA